MVCIALRSGVKFYIKMGQYRRFFALPSERQGETIYLKSEYTHLAKVLRARVGDIVVVCFNDGVDYLCNIANITADEVVLDIINSTPNPCESVFDVTLFQGVIKGNGMDWAVEKAVELGVNRIRPFVGDYTVAECNSSKADRLTKIAHEASKQCGRARLIDVDVALSFDQMLVALAEYDQIIFCNERGGKPISQAIDIAKKKIAIVIGSEGGFSDKEVIKMEQKAQSISLGARILRAETAGLYALAIIDGLIK